MTAQAALTPALQATLDVVAAAPKSVRTEDVAKTLGITIRGADQRLRKLVAAGAVECQMAGGRNRYTVTAPAPATTAEELIEQSNPTLVEAPKPERKGRTPKDPAASDVAKKAAALAPSMKTKVAPQQARGVLDWIAGRPVLDALAEVPRPDGVKAPRLATLKAYAIDGIKPDTGDGLVVAIRAMTAETGDKMIWGRKAAAMLLAVHQGAGTVEA